jgi:hypothetical protein
LSIVGPICARIPVLTQTLPAPPPGLGAVLWLVEAVDGVGVATGLVAVEAATARPHGLGTRLNASCR